MRHTHATSKAAFALLLLFGLCLLPARAADGDRPILRRTAAVYPALAHQMHLSGVVMLSVSVDSAGGVTDIKVQSGHPLLVKAAEDAVRQWKFAPAPAATEASVNVTFNAF
jgi:TonB family protein